MDCQMINLTTCNRSEFIGAYNELTKEIKQLKVKLEQYEGAKPSNADAEKEFQKFWSAYGRKGNVKTTRKRWFNLSNTKQSLAMDKVSAYVKSTPEKCYRKNGEVWLNQECWNDEIVEAAQPFGRPPPVRAQTSVIENDEAENKRLEQAAILRRSSRGRNVRDILDNNKRQG